MSEGNRTPTRQFVEAGNARALVESASDEEDSLRSQLLERKLSSIEVDRRMNTKVAPLATQIETLILSVTEPSESSSNSSTEVNVASERLISPGQLFNRCENFSLSFNEIIHYTHSRVNCTDSDPHELQEILLKSQPLNLLQDQEYDVAIHLNSTVIFTCGPQS